MKNIDLIREVTRAAADRWPTVLAGLHIDVPDSPRRHAPCPACGGSGIASVSMMAAAAVLSATSVVPVTASIFIRKVNKCDTTEAARLAADVLGIDYRAATQDEATASQKAGTNESRKPAARAGAPTAQVG